MSGAGSASESRYRARMMPSVRKIARPSGNTSTSLPVKSVSGAEEEAYSVSDTCPVTSSGSVSTGEVKQSTSSRASAGRWSTGPAAFAVDGIMTRPPRLGTGRRGSYRKV